MKDLLSSKDWELLSSYLDDELNPREKARVEARLQAQPEFKEALDGLRRTKNILRKATIRKIPRSFTLTAADVQPVRTPRWIPTMQWSSAAVALVAVFLFAYQLVPGFSGLIAGASQKSAAPAGALESNQPMAAALPALTETPEVIYWGGPPSPSGPAMGMGGGGGGDGTIIGGGAAIGGGSDNPPTQMPFPQPPVPNAFPDLQPKATESARALVAATPVTGTGPILGVRPEEVQGQTLAQSTTAADMQVSTRESSQQSIPWVWIAAGGLLAVAAGLMIAAILLKRKITD